MKVFGNHQGVLSGWQDKARRYSPAIKQRSIIVVERKFKLHLTVNGLYEDPTVEGEGDLPSCFP
jgi:hypothetical protein